MIGLLLSALDPFKMILLWGLKKIPLLLEIPALKDHLSENDCSHCVGPDGKNCGNHHTRTDGVLL